jgi:DNA repair exonuclease SbcCD ATPase subunit
MSDLVEKARAILVNSIPGNSRLISDMADEIKYLTNSNADLIRTLRYIDDRATSLDDAEAAARQALAALQENICPGCGKKYRDEDWGCIACGDLVPK